MKKVKFKTLLCLLLTLTACRLFNAETQIQIHVVNAAGEPLENANISIQKKLFATTNSEGTALIQTELPVNETLVLEVSKSSDTLFYAPYFENIQVKRGESNTFKLRATLFAVPKSSSQTSQSESIAAEEARGKAQEEAELKSVIEAVNNETVFSLPPVTAEDPLTKDTSVAQTVSTSSLAQEIPQSDLGNGRLLTFYSESNTQALANTNFLIGDTNRLQWIEACTSNARGRCTFTLAHDFPGESITVIARSQGFITQIQNLPLGQGDRFRFKLNRGNSLDIFALQRKYQSIVGLKGIRVLLGEKELGSSDQFGFFSYALPVTTNQSKSLIRLISTDHIPSESVHELVENAPNLIVQNYHQASAASPRVFLLPIHQSGERIGPQQLAWEEKLIRGIRQVILNQPPFEEADLERVGPLLSKLDISPKSLAKKGWQQNELIHEMEYVLRTYIMESPQPTVELSLIDAKGQVVGAAKALLPSKSDDRSVRSILKRISQDLAQKVPFEGSLIESTKEGFKINLGLQKGHALTVGETFTLYGTLLESAGQKRNWTDLGTGTVLEVGEQSSKVRIDELKPKAVASAGQSLRLHRALEKPEKNSVLEAKDKLDKHGLIQANIYFNDRWIGATDHRGTAQISNEILSKRGFLTITKPGYKTFQQDFVPENKAKISYPLERDSLTLRIESIPDQALVRLNGRLLGRTPLYQTTEPIQADVLLEIQLDDYRTFQANVNFDEDGLDFSGEKAIVLEKDPRKEARRLIEQGRLQDAIELLENIAPSHPDFLLATHELGEIYLNRVQDPIKAAATFHRVTSRPEIANFDDKRFIGTHINEAVALYHAGEKNASTEPGVALDFWKKAVDSFDKTEAQIRFVPQEQYTQALHSLYYYRAISLQRSWAITQKTDFLKAAHQAWKSYIQSTALSTPADRNYALLKKAETFYKQTQSLLLDATDTASTEAVQVETRKF